jgi:hypothetical protein
LERIGGVGGETNSKGRSPRESPGDRPVNSPHHCVSIRSAHLPCTICGHARRSDRSGRPVAREPQATLFAVRCRPELRLDAITNLVALECFLGRLELVGRSVESAQVHLLVVQITLHHLAFELLWCFRLITARRLPLCSRDPASQHDPSSQSRRQADPHLSVSRENQFQTRNR